MNGFKDVFHSSVIFKINIYEKFIIIDGNKTIHNIVFNQFN